MGNKQIEIKVVRHGFSKYNNVNKDLTKEEKLYAKTKYEYNEELINCSLHELGYKQCEEFYNKYKNNKEIQEVKYIFVSPFYRCIETLKLSMKDLLKNKKIIVLPLISERLNSICNILDDKDIKLILSEFDVDYTFYDKMIEQYGYHFNLHLIEENDNTKCLKKLILDKNKLYVQEILDQIKKIIPSSIESNQEIFNRGLKVKKFIKNFIKTKKVKPSEIMIFSHSKMLISLNSYDFKNNNFIKNKHFTNCKLDKVMI